MKIKSPQEILIDHRLNPTDLWAIAAMKAYATQWVDEAMTRAITLSDKHPQAAVVINDLLHIRDEIKKQDEYYAFYGNVENS